MAFGAVNDGASFELQRAPSASQASTSEQEYSEGPESKE
jgi:hypothetical protein